MLKNSTYIRVIQVTWIYVSNLASFYTQNEYIRKQIYSALYN